MYAGMSCSTRRLVLTPAEDMSENPNPLSPIGAAAPEPGEVLVEPGRGSPPADHPSDHQAEEERAHKRELILRIVIATVWAGFLGAAVWFVYADPIGAKTSSEQQGLPLFERLIALWVPVVLLPILFVPLRGTHTKILTPKDRAVKLKENMGHLATIQPDDEDFSLHDAEVRYLLASLDKFVDEAQGVLTQRAGVYHTFGAVSFVGAIAVLHIAGALAWATFRGITMDLGDNPTQFIILRIFAALAVATAIYAIVKSLISFGKSFFHEATRLLDRRHALRFGRLYMYLKRENFDFNELEGAFQWHRESQTIFQEISEGQITESLLNQILRTISSTAETVTKVKGAASPAKS
jgi:hypothetical protein